MNAEPFAPHITRCTVEQRQPQLNINLAILHRLQERMPTPAVLPDEW